VDSRIDLQQPVLDGAIYSTNFFNGRLLSARDLTLEQSANREADRRIGRAIGEGIACGLEVSPVPNPSKAAPAVRVKAGLAINRRGETLALSAGTDVALVRSTSTKPASQIFSECQPLKTGAYVTGAGLYLLTIAPAQTVDGRAATSGLEVAKATCNIDTTVNTVQFRLIQIDSAFTPDELKDEAHLRNLVAYKCFGVSDTDDFIANPFGTDMKQWGLLDNLRPNQLTECEVPLALLYWTDKDGLNFIDMWSVRRMLIAPKPNLAWSYFTSNRRRAEAEAMFLQFQNQIDDLRGGANPIQTQLIDRFRYLPPVGVIPLAENGFTNGFHRDLIWQSVFRHSDIYVEGSRLEQILQAGFNYPPVDLQAPDGPVMLWVYRVRENWQANAPGTPTIKQPCVIFSSGHMPFLGDAHFDVNRWDYSNFA